MIERIGKIRGDSLVDLHQWCKDHNHLLKPTMSRYATGRKELWIRRYCDLRRNPAITEGYRDERIEALGEHLLPGFHIGLVLLYPPGIEIKLHRDHSAFKPVAASVNLGDAVFFMTQPSQPSISYSLSDGDAIRFDVKIPHGVEPVSNERWSIVFWHLKDEFVNPTKQKPCLI